MAEVTRAAIQAMAVATVEKNIKCETQTWQTRPMMKQPTFNWEAEDKYNELKNVRLEVNNIFKSYDMPWAKQRAIIKKIG